MKDYELKLVRIEEKEVLRNLIEKYYYEFSQYDNRDVNEFGMYGYNYLDNYWTEENRWPYFIKCNGNLAGFAMINSYTEKNYGKIDYNLSEFFIMHKYRRNGAGKYAANKLFKTYKGTWQVLINKKNTVSEKFWKKTIGEFTDENFKIINLSSYKEDRKVELYILKT